MNGEQQRRMTLQTAAVVFDVSYTSLYAAVRSGEIEDALFGKGRWRVVPDEVEAWLRRSHDEKFDAE